MLQLLLAALASSTGTVVDKITLSWHKVPIRVFAPALFLVLFLITVTLLPWFGSVDVTQLLTFHVLSLFTLMVITAAAWNIFYYQGLQKESIEEFEAIILLVPLVTVVLGALFLPEERNIHIVFAALIASIALLFSHVNKRHLDFDRWTIGLILSVFLMAIEAVFIKKLLAVFSPVALYFARTGFVFLALNTWYGSSLGHMKEVAARLTFVSGICGVISMVLKFYGYNAVGVIYTTLILIISPFLTIILDHFILHEPIHWRKIVSIIVILGAIIYATFAG
ncbi:DMT family transporter [Candidatus Berkelbacteria bacterium]|nr:DMT family transporter [Candidatus Berkelbacteria bacterium]